MVLADIPLVLGPNPGDLILGGVGADIPLVLGPNQGKLLADIADVLGSNSDSEHSLVRL